MSYPAKIPAAKFRTPMPGTQGLPATMGRDGSKLCSFTPPVEREIQPTSSRLLITVGVGGAREILKLSSPSMRAYAARIGADFLALTNCTQDWPLAEKFRIGHYARRYERILFVDADVFIRSDAPDVFATVPPGSIAMHDDMFDLERMGGSPGGSCWIESEIRSLGESQGVKIPRACLNSGVVVFDGKDADIWNAPPKPFPITHCSEQHWIQYQAINKGRLFSLPTEFNWQFWANPDFRGIEDSHFVHLAGVGERCPEMAQPLMRALCLR